MTARSANDLTPEKALIWRMTHRVNIPWILTHGLHCASSKILDSNFVSIGLPDLIQKRQQRLVPITPFGTLPDYIPFYFTPFSPMAYRIFTGRGIQAQPREDICFLVSSLQHLTDSNVPFTFTDRHAYLETARFFSSIDDLSLLDWHAWQNRDFRRNEKEPEAFERYQAEALIHRHLPLKGLRGIVCYSDPVRDTIVRKLPSALPEIKIVTRPEWYF